MTRKIRVVHYLNQFFGQIGGEDKAGMHPMDKAGHVGPGMAFAAALKDQAEIVGTVICGDTYFGENMETATKEVLDLIVQYEPDLVIAGPAFNAGRYGSACGAVCAAVAEKLQIPVVTGMYPENPGVDMFRKRIHIVETSDSAAGMRQAVPKMAELALKLAQGEPTDAAVDGYLTRESARTTSPRSADRHERWRCSCASWAAKSSSLSIRCRSLTGWIRIRRYAICRRRGSHW